MDNIKTVDEKINELNTEGGEWVSIDGIHALTTVVNNGPDKITFNPASGIIIKTFLNKTTGEIKLFPAKIFGFPNTLDI